VEQGACSDNTLWEGKYWSYEACLFTQFAKEGLEAHNKRRTVPLELDADLCEDAQAYANYLAYGEYFKPDKLIWLDEIYPEQGENLAYSWDQTEEAEDVVKRWHGEKITGKRCLGYYNTGGGVYTQVVWKEAKKFCMAKSESASGQIYSVARYFPAGNSGGQSDYERNEERAELIDKSVIFC